MTRLLKPSLVMHLVSDSLFNPASIKLPTPSLTQCYPQSMREGCVFSRLSCYRPPFFTLQLQINVNLANWQYGKNWSFYRSANASASRFSVKRQLKATKIVNTDPRTNASVKQKKTHKYEKKLNSTSSQSAVRQRNKKGVVGVAD